MTCEPIDKKTLKELQERHWPPSLVGCPFCGSDSIAREMVSVTQTGAVFARAICQDCKALGPAGIDGGQSTMKHEWIEKWNERYNAIELTGAASPRPNDRRE